MSHLDPWRWKCQIQLLLKMKIDNRAGQDVKTISVFQTIISLISVGIVEIETIFLLILTSFCKFSQYAECNVYGECCKCLGVSGEYAESTLEYHGENNESRAIRFTQIHLRATRNIFVEYAERILL